MALQLTQASPVASAQHLQVDAAIDWGNGHWPGLASLRLFDCWLAPVLSPELARRERGLQTPHDLQRLPVLHQQTRADWHAWMQLAGIATPRFAQDTVMADANMATQAAIEGQGIALGVFPLVQADVDAGRLVCPWDIRLHTGQTYHLLMTPETQAHGPGRALWDWMAQESATLASGPAERP
jgi:LysR family glycine cleavage system transcriptional activator